MHQLMIKDVRIVDPASGRDTVGDIFIEDGKIAEVGRIDGDKLADHVIDGSGLMALPGLVDMHVHLRDPGQTHKETLHTGALAAAAGGVTSLLAMPNTAPAVDTPAVLEDILERAAKEPVRIYQSACITKGLKGETPTDLSALAAAGATAFTDDGRPVYNSRYMRDALVSAAALGRPVVSHCEDLELAGGGIMKEGPVSGKLGVRGIPNAAEDAAVAREVALAASAGVPLHICHVSTAVSLAVIRAAKRDGVQVTCETGPHYFWFTEEALLGRDADFRMNPPLGSAADKKAVIAALLDGTIDAIATDHAPHSPAEKADFEKAPNGVVGMETSLAASYTALVKTGLMDMADLVRLMSLNPARILGIPGGTLAEGAPADLVLFDPEVRWTVEPDRLHGKSRNTPFKGMELTGKVRCTICRGQLVFQDK